MKFYAIYEEVYGYYKGSCAFKGVTSSRGFDLKVFNNKKERREAQEIEETEFEMPDYEYNYFGDIVGQVGGGFYYYTLRLRIEKAVWKYKDIGFEESSKNEYFKIFISEKEAKEFCDNLNYLSVLFGPELKYLKNAPDDYINKPYYYQENDKIVEEIPTTIFQIQKLFAEHKEKIALSKENLKSNIFVENIHDFYLQKDKEKRRLFIVLKELKEERKRVNQYKEM